MALTQVKTSGLADDAVTGAKIADDTVAEANMANDAISLAELKAGTDGQIITYDASGNPVAVGPGNDGQVLTSTGAGSPPAFETLPASNNYSHPNHSGDVTSSGDGATTIANDAVTSAKIIDNAVTLAKMAGLARGKLIYGDSSGDPAALTVGSANQVLTSDGTDISWAAAGGGLFDNAWYDGDSTETSGIVGSSGETRVGGNSGSNLEITFTPPSTNHRYILHAQIHVRTEYGGQWGWQCAITSNNWTSKTNFGMHPSFGMETQNHVNREAHQQFLHIHPNTTSECKIGMFCQVWASHSMDLDVCASNQSSKLYLYQVADNSLFSGI